jgi:hypothetical protein
MRAANSRVRHGCFCDNCTITTGSRLRLKAELDRRSLCWTADAARRQPDSLSKLPPRALKFCCTSKSPKEGRNGEKSSPLPRAGQIQVPRDQATQPALPPVNFIVINLNWARAIVGEINFKKQRSTRFSYIMGLENWKDGLKAMGLRMGLPMEYWIALGGERQAGCKGEELILLRDE